MRANKILLLADILGFSRLVENYNNSELDSKIEKWLELINRLTVKHNLSKFQLLSDTLFLITEPNKTQFERLQKFSKDLLEEGMKINIPIRGAISSGEVIWGKIIYGKAVIMAHNIERNQNWIGITCKTDLKFEQEFLGYNKLIVYPPPFKSGEFVLRTVIDWEIPSVLQLSTKLSSFFKNGEPIDRQIIEIIDNTSLFNNYKKWLIEKKLSPKRYYGVTYTNFLEANDIFEVK